MCVRNTFSYLYNAITDNEEIFVEIQNFSQFYVPSGITSYREGSNEDTR